jgi:hypothetical protein
MSISLDAHPGAGKMVGQETHMAIDDQKEQKEHDDGGPAFPVDCVIDEEDGMTLLDWFAGKAMQAFLTGGASALDEIFMEDPRPEEDRPSGELVAECCYDLAAALVAEKRRREK